MDWVLPLLGGLGIGSLIKGIVDHFLVAKSKSNDRAYQEAKDSYIGLLSALRDVNVNPSNENLKSFGLWHARCEIFGSKSVSNAAQKMVDTNHEREKKGSLRETAYQELLSAMRQDLDAR